MEETEPVRSETGTGDRRSHPDSPNGGRASTESRRRADAEILLDFAVEQGLRIEEAEVAATEDLLTAMSPRVAVISMSPWNDRRRWTAWQYGHPRSSVVQDLVANVSRRRTTKTVRVATATKRFRSYTMRKAVFATGWDGTVVVFARSDGRMTVRTY